MFTSFLVASAKRNLNFSNPYIEYIIPSSELAILKANGYDTYMILIAMCLLSVIMGILGIIVEYTNFGTKSLSYEDANIY